MALVAVRFIFQYDDGRRQLFTPGEEVPADIVDHWFVKPHLQSEPGDPAPAEAVSAPVTAEAQPEPEAAAVVEPAPDAPPAAPEVPRDFDALSDDDLRAYLAQREGKAPHWKAGRVRLLELARGAPVTADDAD